MLRQAKADPVGGAELSADRQPDLGRDRARGRRRPGSRPARAARRAESIAAARRAIRSVVTTKAAKRPQSGAVEPYQLILPAPEPPKIAQNCRRAGSAAGSPAASAPAGRSAAARSPIGRSSVRVRPIVFGRSRISSAWRVTAREPPHIGLVLLQPRQYRDGAIDRGDERGAERERRRHRPAIAVDDDRRARRPAARPASRATRAAAGYRHRAARHAHRRRRAAPARPEGSCISGCAAARGRRRPARYSAAE